MGPDGAVDLEEVENTSTTTSTENTNYETDLAETSADQLEGGRACLAPGAGMGLGTGGLGVFGVDTGNGP